jgi:crotonobetainyl-CoA:carnitine CoA-transferase CaiB-like acyl-CoA transferase
MEKRPMASEGALAGLTVIDLTRILSGPYCTQILADHGAAVIKVEPPGGDETRGWGPPFVEGTASYYIGVNRNKRGIVLDLGGKSGQDALYGLLAGADVLIENYKPGTLEKWGMTRDVLEQRFPRLVHCRISGFGADGPMGGLPGYDAAVQAVAGLMSINGRPEDEPMRMGVPIVDLAAGLNAAIGILMALYERAQSDRGQFIDIALYDCGLSLLHPYVANYFASGKTPNRVGNAHPNITPYDTFATATTPIFLAVGNDAQFQKLCAELGRPELAGEARFKTNSDRNSHRGELKPILEDLLQAHECEPLAGRLLQRGVPCGPVRDLPGAVNSPHAAHRGMVVESGDYKGMGWPIKLSRTPAQFRSAPPRLGEHTEEVLATPAKKVAKPS